MAWRKKNGTEVQNEPEQEETEPRRNDMSEELDGLSMAVEAAQRFIKNATKADEMLSGGMAPETFKKSPEARRLKRASLDLSSELVILRKAMP